MTIKDKELVFSDSLDDISLFPGSQLRNLSQKEWVNEALKHDKIGLIVNNELQLALMHWKRYKEMYEALHHLKNKNKVLEQQVEDLEAALEYSQRAEIAERDLAGGVSGDTPDKALDNLLKDVYSRSRKNK